MRRILLLLPVILYAQTSPCRADEDPCAQQYKEWTAAKSGTPEYDQAYKYWQSCQAIVSQQKKTELAGSRDTWAASLDKLPNGGWIYLTVSPDGTYAVFGSHRHAIREGNVVALWLRYEYRESQTNHAAVGYKSVVERDMYDCARVTSKAVADTYYSDNNLGGGGGTSYTYEEKSVTWVPVIPGTLGDTLLDWACKSVPRPQPAKAQ